MLEIITSGEMIMLVLTTVVTVAMTALVFREAKRRPLGTPITWGEAFAAAVFLFALMFLAYGIVPHQWLTLADGPLEWRRDAFFFGEDGISIFGRGAIRIPKEVIRDIIATGIYVVFLGIQGFMWTWWQRRGKKAAARGELTSAFGRPLVRKV